MSHALWTGASGMSAQQTNVDVIANNIANVNTTGFKRQRVNFQDLFYDVVTAPGTRASDQGRNPTGIQVGHGVKLSSTPRIFTPGNVEVTNNEFDLAIEGDGFFTVSLPDGSSAYTRAGDFRPDGEGNLVTPDGYFMEPRITVPEGTDQFSVSTTGVVTVLVDGVQSDIGTLTLTRFRNPAGLIAGGRNLFIETIASGAPNDGTPGEAGLGSLRNGALEKANVEIVNELVSLIVAQRAFEMNSKSITTADQMLQTANEIIR
ncbi:MAG: flagellar basal-body rod protein FlgG [Planctomycetes bacterium]|nr:flagellar basal-body rod protein FlgG [Planctomycetota bacterium]